MFGLFLCLVIICYIHGKDFQLHLHTDGVSLYTQVVELPPVELVSSGTILAQDIKACDEKVDIWALGVTLFELLTGALASW